MQHFILNRRLRKTVGMSRLPTAAVERIMKKSGATRVSRDAVRTLTRLLEEIAAESSKQAVRRAKKANRKKVEEEDIALPKHD